MVAKEIGRAAHQASAAMQGRGETPVVELKDMTYPADQVLGDWLPS